MSLIKSKQIQKVIAAPIKITALSITSGNNAKDVTSAITSALSIAGNNASAVPLQISSTVYTQGVVVATPSNRSDIFNNVSKQKYVDAQDNEIYGRITFETSSYVLRFFSLDSSGVENAYTFTTNQTIDFDFVYRFTFDSLPADSMVSSQTRNVSQDPKGQNATQIIEKLSIPGTNTLSALTSLPTYPTKTILVVNGKEEFCVGSSPSFAMSGTGITWSSVNAGYSIETTDVVYAKYYV